MSAQVTTPVSHEKLVERAKQAVDAFEEVLAAETATEAAPAVPTVASKEVVKASVALKQADAVSKPPVTPKPAARVWRFVKLFSVADVLRFADKSTFQFKAVRRNDGSGFSSSSEVLTSDEALASNLRAAAKNPAVGIVEVK